MEPIGLIVQCDGKKNQGYLFGYLSHWWMVVLLPETWKACQEKEWIYGGKSKVLFRLVENEMPQIFKGRCRIGEMS